MAKIDHKKVARLIESNQKENLILAAQILIGGSKCHRNYYDMIKEWRRKVNDWTAEYNIFEHDSYVSKYIINDIYLYDIISKESRKNKFPPHPTPASKLNHMNECSAIDTLINSEIPQSVAHSYGMVENLKLYPPNDPTTLQVIEQIKTKYQR